MYYNWNINLKGVFQYEKNYVLLISYLRFFLATVSSTALGYDENSEIKYLQSVGIPNEVFDSLSNERIHELYLRAKSGGIKYLGKDTIYYNSDEGDASEYGTIPSADMSLDIIAVLILKADQITIDGILFFIDYAWAVNHPMVQKEDAVAVNWDESLFLMAANSFESEDKAYVGNKLFGTCNPNDSPMALNQGGLGYSVDFYPAEHVANLTFKGSASFELKPRSKMYDGDSKLTAVNVQYTHDKTALGFSLGFSYEGVGVSITPTPLSDSVAKTKTIYYR